jgi:hypothetical protein
MKNFIIEDIEKDVILKMHKSLLKEQTQDVNLVKLRQAVIAGCLKNGSLKVKKSTGEYFYRKPSAKNPGKEVDFFANMTYKFSDGSKSGKWVCPEIANIVASQQVTQQTTADNESKIATEIKKGWKKIETLRAEGIDLTTLDRVYDTQVVGNVTLYRPKGSSTTFTQNTSTTDFNKDQLAFVEKFESLGYKKNPSRIEQSTMVKVTDKELGAPVDLFPNGLTLYYNPNTQKNIKSDQSLVSGILKNQAVDREACRKNIEGYYRSFKTDAFADPATIYKIKAVVQACKNQHYGKWGVLGGGKKLDNYLDILSGVKEGGPSSYGDNSKWRLK